MKTFTQWQQIVEAEHNVSDVENFIALKRHIQGVTTAIARGRQGVQTYAGMLYGPQIQQVVASYQQLVQAAEQLDAVLRQVGGSMIPANYGD